MKKAFMFVAMLFCAFSVAVPAQAVPVEINFDEMAAWNTEPPTIADNDAVYVGMGADFVYALDGTSDGAIQDAGNWGINVSEGGQFLGCDGVLGGSGWSSGFVIEFAEVQSSVMFDFTIGTGTTGTQDLAWNVVNGASFVGFGSAALPAVGDWVTVTAAPMMGSEFTALIVYIPFEEGEVVLAGYDNINFDGTAIVPIPASVLLLGTGLLPLIRLRKRG